MQCQVWLKLQKTPLLMARLFSKLHNANSGLCWFNKVPVVKCLRASESEHVLAYE